MSGEESLQESDLAALGAGILIEQDTLIRTMKGSGKKLRKNRKRADQMLALRSIIPEVASRCETREEVSERELEETHRTHIASCLEELERQAEEEFLQQGSQVDQLMSKHTTAVPLTSLSQPTPEREANLEENMMTHSKVNSILMGEGVEGLMSEVQREREKYPSLLEENRLLEETQMRMTELTISPGPPPPPNTHHAHSLPPAPSPLPYCQTLPPATLNETGTETKQKRSKTTKERTKEIIDRLKLKTLMRVNLTYGRESEGHILKALKKGIYGTRDELEEDLDAYVEEKRASRCRKVKKRRRIVSGSVCCCCCFVVVYKHFLGRAPTQPSPISTNTLNKQFNTPTSTLHVPYRTPPRPLLSPSTPVSRPTHSFDSLSESTSNTNLTKKSVKSKNSVSEASPGNENGMHDPTEATNQNQDKENSVLTTGTAKKNDSTNSCIATTSKPVAVVTPKQPDRPRSDISSTSVHKSTTFRSPSNQLPNMACPSFYRKQKRCSTEVLEENVKIAH